ncbi:hypothetical protein B0H15DRAFT_956782 [Mycena belliarum]|uniref:Uncharacterized protein n=1 Tax=Mycena belliarum TaxID=1033014 RepID=A0AAD6TTK3_9AGAR|nr:hypothetical protein B0H15DRAFT_956782 [Mycena belliae]
MPVQPCSVTLSAPMPPNLPPLPTNLAPPRPGLPRRSTYGAETTHTRVASSSQGAHRPASVPMSIDVNAPPRVKIRPLPPIPPSPKSPPPFRRQVSQPSLRPLPSVPEAPVSFSITPATPLPPLSPLVQSSTHLAPPVVLAPVRRFASISLRLNTSPDALASRASKSMLPSPPHSPGFLVPEPPSPATAKRKRISKLRRHLGESVAFELFPESDSTSPKGADLHSQTVFAVKKLLALSDGDAGSDNSDSSDEEGDEDNYSLMLITHDAEPLSVPVRRHSRKWIREKGGERWVEENISNILRELRSL